MKIRTILIAAMALLCLVGCAGDGNKAPSFNDVLTSRRSIRSYDVVSLSEGEEPWDDSRRYQDISGLRNFDDEDGYFMFGAGEGYTRIICSTLGDDGRAAFWCRLQGEGWYLPSAGELFKLVSTYSKNPMVKSALKNYRGGEIRGWYWSSSENDRDEAWNVSDGGSISTEEKDERNRVRAIRIISE